MPCNCDHMEPTAAEIHRKNAAIGLRYLLKELGKQVPRHVIRGAIDSYGNPGLDDEDINVRSLCELMHELNEDHPAETFDKLVYNGRKREARLLAEWWEEHQEEDRIRQAEEDETEEYNRIVEKIRSYLTPDEFDIVFD